MMMLWLFLLLLLHYVAAQSDARLNGYFVPSASGGAQLNFALSPHLIHLPANFARNAFFFNDTFTTATDSLLVDFRMTGTNATNRLCVYGVYTPQLNTTYVPGAVPVLDDNTVCFQQSSTTTTTSVSLRGNVNYDPVPYTQDDTSSVYRVYAQPGGLVVFYINGLQTAALTITTTRFSVYGVVAPGNSYAFTGVQARHNVAPGLLTPSQSVGGTLGGALPDNAYTGASCVQCSNGGFYPWDARIGKLGTGYQTFTNGLEFLQISLPVSHVITDIVVESVLNTGSTGSLSGFYAVGSFTLTVSDNYTWTPSDAALTTAATSASWLFTTIANISSVGGGGNGDAALFQAFNTGNGGDVVSSASTVLEVSVREFAAQLASVRAIRIYSQSFINTQGVSLRLLKADLKGYPAYKAGPFVPLGMISGAIPSSRVHVSSCAFCPFGLYLPSYGRVNTTDPNTAGNAYMGSVGAFQQIVFSATPNTYYYVTHVMMQALFVSAVASNYGVTRFRVSYAVNATAPVSGYIQDASQDALFRYVTDPLTQLPMTFSNPLNPVPVVVPPAFQVCANTTNRFYTVLLYKSATGNSIEKCQAAAIQAHWTFFGLEYGEECWAGNGGVPFPTQDYIIPTSLCNMPCPGNAAEKCGGFFAVSIYDAKRFSQTNPEWGVTRTIAMPTPFLANAVRIHAVTCQFNCAFKTEIIGNAVPATIPNLNYLQATTAPATASPTTPAPATTAVPTTAVPTTATPTTAVPTTAVPTTKAPTTPIPTVNVSVVITAVAVTTAFRITVESPSSFVASTHVNTIRLAIAVSMGVDASLLSNIRVSVSPIALGIHHKPQLMATGLVYIAFDASSVVALQFFNGAATTIGQNMLAFGWVMDPSFVITLTAATLPPTTSTPTTPTAAATTAVPNATTLPPTTMLPTLVFGIPLGGDPNFLNAILIDFRVIVDSPSAFVASAALNNNTLTHLIALSLGVADERVSNLTLSLFAPLQTHTVHLMSVGFVYVSFRLIDVRGTPPHTNDLALVFVQAALVTNSALAVNMRFVGVTVDTSYTPNVRIGVVVPLLATAAPTVVPTTAAPVVSSSSSSSFTSDHYLLAGVVGGSIIVAILLGLLILRWCNNSMYAELAQSAKDAATAAATSITDTIAGDDDGGNE